MISSYQIVTTILQSGERFPLLISRDSGLPDFNSTAFTLQKMRSRGLASNTIEQALRSIEILLLFLDQHDIDLEARFREGRTLTMGEVEALHRMCQIPKQQIAKLPVNNSRVDSKIVSIDRVLRAAPPRPDSVSNSTVSIRLTYSGRFKQQRSLWDTLHPGRSWAEKCVPNAISPKAVMERVEAFLEGKLVPVRTTIEIVTEDD